MSEPKPIRVFYSDLGEHGTFYATQHWRLRKEASGLEYIEITGKKYDVTQDIAHAIVRHDVEFTPAPKETES